MNVNNYDCAGHNLFQFDDKVVFSSNFDNGNLANVERVTRNEYRLWSSPDNGNTQYQSKNNNGWFYFSLEGFNVNERLKFHVLTATQNALYRHDMRPVVKCSSTGNKWTRIKNSVRAIKKDDSALSSMYFEYNIESKEDTIIYFAFTYPYNYTMLQNDLLEIEKANNIDHNITVVREVLTYSCDHRNIDILTITSCDGASNEREPSIEGLYPDNNDRPFIYPNKEIIFVSARVHAGEVPSSYTMKGILSFLIDKDDMRAKELRHRYVFKLIPMLNPDGVYQGNFRHDQYGHNLNRYYHNPDSNLHPSIYAASKLLEYYSISQKLTVYLDLHAHTSKRGCFIYGNVLNERENQIQNQLYCKLIAMNTPYFEYDSCLFSREHMTRIDPGDQKSGLTAEGSGRVFQYLTYGLIHSYTLECNYNSSKNTNELAPLECNPYTGEKLTQEVINLTDPTVHVNGCLANAFPEKYTPLSYASVGRACIIALLDIRGHNPCSRIPKTKFKCLEKLRHVISIQVKQRKEYQNQPPVKQGGGVVVMSAKQKKSKSAENLGPNNEYSINSYGQCVWRRVEPPDTSSSTFSSSSSTSTSMKSTTATAIPRIESTSSMAASVSSSMKSVNQVIETTGSSTGRSGSGSDGESENGGSMKRGESDSSTDQQQKEFPLIKFASPRSNSIKDTSKLTPLPLQESMSAKLSSPRDFPVTSPRQHQLTHTDSSKSDIPPSSAPMSALASMKQRFLSASSFNPSSSSSAKMIHTKIPVFIGNNRAKCDHMAALVKSFSANSIQVSPQKSNDLMIAGGHLILSPLPTSKAVLDLSPDRPLPTQQRLSPISAKSSPSIK